MLVELPTITQAARVASTTRWPVLPGEKPGSVSRRLDAGGCFEDHRAAVEAVSVLFKLFDLEGCQVESGWRVSAARFEVEWPDDRSVVRSHFGARRKAYNWALGQVKADLDARRDDPSHVSVDWNLGELRKEWNRQKDIVGPWWAENSKECYSSGIRRLGGCSHQLVEVKVREA